VVTQMAGTGGPAPPRRPGAGVASFAVQLRTAARTLASLDLPPEDIAHRPDQMAAGMPAAPFASGIYAAIDPERNS